MSKLYEFELRRQGYAKMEITVSQGRFYQGQRVWGRYIKNVSGNSWSARIVNEAGTVLSTIPARYTRKV